MKIPFLDLKKTNSIYQEEINDVVLRVSNSGWYILGKESFLFEEAFSNYCGSKYCVGVGNGLDAIRLILMAYCELGVFKEGDEIIVPANTYIATILAISASGLTPVLVEPDIATYNIDPFKIEEKITSRTKAILAVHLYGLVCDMDSLKEIANKYDLRLIDDAAQAHGSVYKDVKVGALCDTTAFSFYPTKNLGAIGDAGAVTSNNEDLIQMVRSLSNYGSVEKYVHEYKGINSRLDEIQAAVLTAKLKYLDQDILKRQEIADFYTKNICNSNVILPSITNLEEHSFHLYVIRSSRRNELATYLQEKGVQTQIHYPTAPHLQKAYAEWNNFSYPITEQIHREVLSLPLYPNLSQDEIEYVVKCINDFD